jgi:secreted PhoX family phosphatase
MCTGYGGNCYEHVNCGHVLANVGAVRPLSRRDFLASGLAALGAVPLSRILPAPRVTDGPYGPLQAPDANGLRLPEGFTSRVIARAGRDVSGYTWHDYPDGGACFEDGDGWIYVSNSEVGGAGGGVGAIRFDADGRIADAYRIASRTSRNCSGGPTPWGTWLTCEEYERGQVWECDPRGEDDAKVLPGLGVFRHEAAAVDPVGEHVYLTEDEGDGRFYRFVPDRYPDLESGTLQVAQVASDGATRWLDVPDPGADDEPTRRQVAASTRFDGGEGTWFDAGVVYFTTKGDNRVWGFDTRSERMSLIYDAAAVDRAPLTGVDNITGSSRSGDLFVAEDGGDLEIVMITPDDEVARLLRVTGDEHRGSELAGPALNPTGDRFYFSSQRGFGKGITYEITGPFRTTRVDRPDVASSPLPIGSGQDSSTQWALPGGIAAAGVVAAIAVVIRRRSRPAASRPDE